jgi:hypothetical protein
MSEIGIVIEALGALYLVIIAYRARRDATVKGLVGDQVTYDQLGPLLNTVLHQLHSNYRHQVAAFALLFLGLGLQLIGSLAGIAATSSADRSWQGYATNKRTGKVETWEAYRASRDDCLRDMAYDLRESVHAQWYREPFGCMFVGSDNKYRLYATNRLLNASVFGCVARLKKADRGRVYLVTLTVWAKETEWYRCELPE